MSLFTMTSHLFFLLQNGDGQNGDGTKLKIVFRTSWSNPTFHCNCYADNLTLLYVIYLFQLLYTDHIYMLYFNMTVCKLYISVYVQVTEGESKD